MNIMNIKVKDLKTGEVHRLKNMTKTYCGIDIKKNELNWCIVGDTEKINCTKKQCEKPLFQIFNKVFFKLSLFT